MPAGRPRRLVLGRYRRSVMGLGRPRRGAVVAVAVLGMVGFLGAAAAVVVWQQGWLLESYRAAVAPCPPFRGGPPVPAPNPQPTVRLAPLVPGATSVTMLAHHSSGLSFMVDRSGQVWALSRGARRAARAGPVQSGVDRP
jgi:hypothetical protein